MRWLRFLLGGLAAGLLGIGQAAEPTPPPKTATAPPSRQAIPHETYQLANGLRVILQEDHRNPFITLCLRYRIGALQESPGRSGIAHFFEHLMFEGSKSTLPRNAHHILSELGAVDWNATTSWDATIYHETFAAGSEMLGRALFPDTSAYSRTVVGSMDDLNDATTQDMRDFYKNWYGPNNAILVLVGDFTPAAARQLVSKYFDAVPRRGEPFAPAAIELPAVKEGRLRMQDPVAAVPALLIGWPSPQQFSDDDGVGDVVAEILERRLRKRIAVVMNWVVQASVRLESRRTQSLFKLSILVKNSSQFNKTLLLVDALLDELRQNTATEEEVARARLALTTSLYWQLEEQLTRAKLISEYFTYHGTADWFREDLARYQKVTVDDVGRFARDTLRPEARVVVDVERAAGEAK